MNDAAPDILVIQSEDGTLMVRLPADGGIEFGPAYDPNVVARMFWQAIADAAPRAADAATDD